MSPTLAIVFVSSFLLATAIAVFVWYLADVDFLDTVCRLHALVEVGMTVLSPLSWGLGALSNIWKQKYSKRKAVFLSWLYSFCFILLMASAVWLF